MIDYIDPLKCDVDQINRFLMSDKKGLLIQERFLVEVNRIVHAVVHRVWINEERVLKYIHENKDSLDQSTVLKGIHEKAISKKVARIFNGTYQPKNGSKGYIQFFVRFLKDPATVGSLAPSSKQLAKTIAGRITKMSEEKRVILEVGPGTGAFTDKIIKRMGKNDVLYLVEFDSTFAELLRNKYADMIKSGKIVLLEGDILAQDFPEKFDHIISGLPLNALPAEFAQKVFVKFETVAKAGAQLSYFDYMFLPSVKSLWSGELLKILQEKDSFYKKHQGAIDHVWSNLTPANVKHHTIA